MNYTYKPFMGKVYRVDMRPQYRRRRFAVVLVAAAIAGGVLGIALPYVITPPDGANLGCGTPGTLCWEDQHRWDNATPDDL